MKDDNERVYSICEPDPEHKKYHNLATYLAVYAAGGRDFELLIYRWMLDNNMKIVSR